MEQHPEVFWGLIASMYVGNLMLLVLNLPLVGLFVNLLRVPQHFLFRAFFICFVGVYSVNLSASLAGHGDRRGGRLSAEEGALRSGADRARGVVLGPMMEQALRRDSRCRRASSGSSRRPISAAGAAAAALFLGIHLVATIRRTDQARRHGASRRAVRTDGHSRSHALARAVRTAGRRGAMKRERPMNGEHPSDRHDAVARGRRSARGRWGAIDQPSAGRALPARRRHGHHRPAAGERRPSASRPAHGRHQQGGRRRRRRGAVRRTPARRLRCSTPSTRSAKSRRSTSCWGARCRSRKGQLTHRTVAVSPFAIMVNAESRGRRSNFVEEARQKPDEFQYASAGVYSTTIM